MPEVSEMAEICRKYNYTYGRFYNLRMRYSIPCVKANATKCFPKAEVDKAMAQEAERLGSNLSEHWYSCFDIMRLFGLGKTQVRRFALTHGVRTKRIHGNRLYYLKADWDEDILPPNELMYELNGGLNDLFYSTMAILTDTPHPEDNPTGKGLHYARYRAVEFLQGEARKK